LLDNGHGIFFVNAGTAPRPQRQFETEPEADDQNDRQQEGHQNLPHDEKIKLFASEAKKCC
jgi:hypothetical protein